jgi:hypothetical protein
MTNWIRGLAVLAGVVTTVLAGPAWAGDAQPSAEARAIVSRQFDAFARDDAAGAYALVTPSLKMTFTDPDVFIGMVRNRYAPVYRHRDVDFGDAEVEGDAMTITATLVDGDNQLWTALYTLERQPDGRWLINSCKLIRPLESALRTGRQS